MASLRQSIQDSGLSWEGYKRRLETRAAGTAIARDGWGGDPFILRVVRSRRKVRHQARLFDLLHDCPSLENGELDSLLLLVNIR